VIVVLFNGIYLTAKQFLFFMTFDFSYSSSIFDSTQMTVVCMTL